MGDTVILTISDTTKVSGGDTHTIEFRPLEAGNIVIRSTAESVPSHSETGLLGRLDLRRPGQAKPVASYSGRLGSGNLLEVTYAATQADLAPAGNWRCQVVNGTEADITFDTTIAYPSTIPIEHKVATFDLTLLGLLISEAVAAAGLNFHIQSSASASDPMSSITWSTNVADSLPGSLKGQTGTSFQVDDDRIEGDVVIGTATWLVLRIVNFDSDPDAPVRTSITSANGVPALQVWMTLNAKGAEIVGVDSDIDLDKLSIVVDIQNPTIAAQVDFYGAGLSATVDLSASVSVAGSPSIGLSDYVKGKIQTKINDKLNGLSPKQLRQYIDAFFVNLMRLGSQATINTYQADANNQTLTVAYSVPAPVQPTPPVQPAPPVRPVAPVVVAG